MKALPTTILIAVCGFLGCTKANPDLCCTDEANCQSLGIPTSDMCSDGLVCRGNQCIAETCGTNTDCDASLPFCSSDMLCAATCDDNSQCPGFGEDATDTFCSNGACVQCLMNSDCPAATPACSNNACVQCLVNSDCSGATPICDGDACRGCAADSECPSGACGANGACIDEADLMYVTPTGTDAGNCPNAAPCATIQYAITQATATRSQIVLAQATYTERLSLQSSVTAASTITIYGGGATLMLPASGDDGLIDCFDVGLDLHHVIMVGNTSASVLIQTGTVPSVIDNVQFSNAATAILVDGSSVTVTNVQINNVSFGIHVLGAGSLQLDRAVIHGGMNPILVKAAGDGSVNITNLLAYDARAPLDLTGAQGTIAFSTIGATNGEAAGLNCSSTVTVDSTIVWNLSATAIAGTCQAIHSTIAGPTAVPGATNTDPLFVNDLQSDYHLTATSPAVDMVDSGPALDFEGDARPQGTAYDIGADEYKP